MLLQASDIYGKCLVHGVNNTYLLCRLSQNLTLKASLLIYFGFIFPDLSACCS